MFIQTEATPNPSTLKFLPGQTVLEEGTEEFRSTEEAQRSPLATRLFALEGVSGVLFSKDYVSVSVKQDMPWPHIKPLVLGAIMEHFMSDAPLLNDHVASLHSMSEEEDFDDKDAETVKTIKEILETRVRPAVAQDGGDITFKGFRDGIVFLTMRGACAGCPSSTMTLKHGIENLLRHFLPNVQEVRAVT